MSIENKNQQEYYYIIEPTTYQDGGILISSFRLRGNDKITESQLRDSYREKTNETFEGQIDWSGVRKVDKELYDEFGG